jgi:hypothetical protein
MAPTFGPGESETVTSWKQSLQSTHATTIWKVSRLNAIKGASPTQVQHPVKQQLELCPRLQQLISWQSLASLIPQFTARQTNMKSRASYSLNNLSIFKSKILTGLSDTQENNGQLLISLMGQCFQEVCLTKWTSVIAKQCPNNADRMKANFNKCIRDYLEAVAGFPNIGDQLIRWLCMAKKPALMSMHELMWR